MADNPSVRAGTVGGTIVVVADEITSPYTGDTAQAQGIKIIDGVANGVTPVHVTSTGMLSTFVGNAGTVTVSGTPNVHVTNSGTVTATDGGSTLSVDDGAGSLTVDNAALAVTGGGVEATALRVTVATDSTGVLSVDDNGSTLSVDDGGSSLTVDGTVAATQSGTWTVQPGNTANTTAWKVDASSVAVPVTDNSGSLTVDNAGTFAVQVDGSALTALQLIDDPVIADDTAFTPATSKVMMAGFQADETATDSVDEGDAGAVRMTLDRKLIVNPQPHTAGGLSVYRSLDLDETEEEVKASAGQLYGWAVTNTATSTRWLKFYNATAANTTVGTTPPVITWGIPGNSSDDVGANLLGALGIAFDTAICFAATTGFADADTGAPGTNDVIINVFYK